MSARLVKILEDVQSDIGAPSPKIISDEQNVYLFFYLQKRDPHWDGTSVHVRSDADAGIAVVKFNSFEQYKFGAPNDEAIEGHPYYAAGLKPYAIYQVENSDWIEQLERQNSVHPYHKPEHYAKLQHLIFFFHDTCFEIVCKDYTYEVLPEAKMKERMREVVSDLN